MMTWIVLKLLSQTQGRQHLANGNGYSESRPGAVGEASDVGHICKKCARSLPGLAAAFPYHNACISSVSIHLRLDGIHV